MSFPESAVIARIEALRLDPDESGHHPDCPQIMDEAAPCRCRELDDADAADRADDRRKW